MTRVNRKLIKETANEVVLIDDVCLGLSIDDVAKDTGWLWLPPLTAYLMKRAWPPDLASESPNSNYKLIYKVARKTD
jgi:hypothetical protein